jgi:hypothetical protein
MRVRAPLKQFDASSLSRVDNPIFYKIFQSDVVAHAVYQERI